MPRRGYIQPSNELVLTVGRLYAEGLSTQELAEIFGLARSTIQRYTGDYLEPLDPELYEKCRKRAARNLAEKGRD